MSSRKYNNDRRAESALKTRQRILVAAAQELREVGYHAMTVASLARRAGVSPQTIYNAVGSKAAVIKSLYDVLVVGDDEPVPLGRRPEFEAVLQQPDAFATVRAYFALGAQLYRRVGELLGIVLADGPGGDTELKEFAETIDRERRTGNEFIVEHLRTTFGLPPDRTPEWIVDVFWAVTSFELADRLVRRCGWQIEACYAWAADVVIMSLWGSEALGAKT